MSDEIETKEASVKVEFHFHISFPAAPQPDWAAGTSGGSNASRFYGDPPRKSRWVAKSVGVVGLVFAAVVGASLVQRVIQGPESREQIAARTAREVIDQGGAPRWQPPADANVERSVVGNEASQVGAEAPRRGTAAFGLR